MIQTLKFRWSKKSKFCMQNSFEMMFFLYRFQMNVLKL